MSSTSRGAVRQEFDYYATPARPIEDFLKAWRHDDAHAATMMDQGPILDPCAGGNRSEVQWEYKPARNGKPAQFVTVPPSLMAYPSVINPMLHTTMITNDLRPDSPAQYHVDATDPEALGKLPRFAVAITNPPFALAMGVIKATLELLPPTGYLALLLRLNFMGSEERSAFMRAQPPQRLYVHSKRISFIGGAMDSVEYAHFVWQKGALNDSTIMRVI